MQANGKLAMPFDIQGNKFIIDCIRPETILCRKQNAMLTMAAMLRFPCVAVEVLGASAFFTVVSPSSALLSEASTPTPWLPGAGRLVAQRAPAPRPWCRGARNRHGNAWNLRARGVAEGRARRSEGGGEKDALSCDLMAFPLAGSARAVSGVSAVVTMPVPGRSDE